MLNVDQIERRFFEITIGGKELQIETPTKGVFAKIIDLSQTLDVSAIEKLSEAVEVILNMNKTGYKIPQKIIDALVYDQLIQIITAYFEWVGEIRQSKNS